MMNFEIGEKLKDSKSRLIEWLVNNEATVYNITVSTIASQIVHPLFEEEYREQRYERIKELVQDEISRDLGLTSGEFSATIDEDMFKKYLVEICK